MDYFIAWSDTCWESKAHFFDSHLIMAVRHFHYFLANPPLEKLSSYRFPVTTVINATTDKVNRNLAGDKYLDGGESKGTLTTMENIENPQITTRKASGGHLANE